MSWAMHDLSTMGGYALTVDGSTISVKVKAEELEDADEDPEEWAAQGVFEDSTDALTTYVSRYKACYTIMACNVKR